MIYEIGHSTIEKLEIGKCKSKIYEKVVYNIWCRNRDKDRKINQKQNNKQTIFIYLFSRFWSTAGHISVFSFYASLPCVIWYYLSPRYSLISSSHFFGDLLITLSFFLDLQCIASVLLFSDLYFVFLHVLPKTTKCSLSYPVQETVSSVEFRLS